MLYELGLDGNNVPMASLWVEDFCTTLRLDKGLSANTLQAYAADLEQFESWIEGSAQHASHEECRRYLKHLTKGKLSPSSLRRKVSSLRQFFLFCINERGLNSNPMEGIEPPKPTNNLPKALTMDAVQALLSTTQEGEKPADQRLRAMIYLLYATGLRISELLGLTMDQVDLETEFIRVNGKGSKERVVPFATEAGHFLAEYLKTGRPRLQPKTDHIFVGPSGRPLSRQAVWKQIKALALRAGITEEVSPHTMRHSFASHLLQSGMNLRTLQMLLGHSDPVTTQIYTKLSPEHLKEVHRRYHPKGSES